MNWIDWGGWVSAEEYCGSDHWTFEVIVIIFGWTRITNRRWWYTGNNMIKGIGK